MSLREMTRHRHRWNMSWLAVHFRALINSRRIEFLDARLIDAL